MAPSREVDVRRVLVIGIGAGDPDQVTVQAVRALNRADAYFLVDKGPSGDDLARVRDEILDRHVVAGRVPRRVLLPEASRDRTADDYETAVDDWRAARLAAYEAAIVDLGPSDTGAFLVWGDPSLYDGTITLLDDVRSRGVVEFEVEVIPGISAAAALAARHRVALNRIGESILFTTGRQLRTVGLPDGVNNAVVFLDAGEAYRDIDDDLDIWWGAYVGTDDELLVSGSLAERRDVIARVRADARARKGWMFDTYLLRRRP
jgi:precorrin-6A synthase